MRELTLEERKEMSLGILCDIDRICRQHGIKYYLAYGSLIGAVRHHGFIPWDDDIDIWMPIAEMERFQQYIKEETKYIVLSWWDNIRNVNYFSKINYPGTKMIDAYTNTPEEYPRGLAVDIFPLIAYTPEKKKKTDFIERMDGMRRWYSLTKGQGSTGIKGFLKREIMKIDSLIHKDNLYWRHIDYKYKLFGGGGGDKARVLDLTLWDEGLTCS